MDPDRDHLRQPSGIALDRSGRWLLVTGGNWDLRETAGTLMAIDLSELHEGLMAPRFGTKCAFVRRHTLPDERR